MQNLKSDSFCRASHTSNFNPSQLFLPPCHGADSPSHRVRLQGTCVTLQLRQSDQTCLECRHQLMKWMTQGTLSATIITQGSLGALVFIGSCGLLFMLCFKVDLMLNGMAGAPFRWRTFITITSALNCYYWKASVSFFTNPTQYKMLSWCKMESESKRSWHGRAQMSCREKNGYFSKM